jgi:hypothetical protein
MRMHIATRSFAACCSADPVQPVTPAAAVHAENGGTDRLQTRAARHDIRDISAPTAGAKVAVSRPRKGRQVGVFGKLDTRDGFADHSQDA